MGTLRRTALQQILLTALGLGIRPEGVIRRGERIGQAWAASSPKQAVLIGIDHYPDQGEGSVLQGCLMDLELQKEVLIHRFGFDPAMILLLKETEVTSQGIQAALNQCKGHADTVVVHFSGHGCLLTPPAEDPEQEDDSTDREIDREIDPKLDQQAQQPGILIWEPGGKAVQSLPLPTLVQWIQDLEIPNVTTVLDCGFAYGDPPLRGNLRLRSRPRRSLETLSAFDSPAATATGFPPVDRGVLFAATTPQELAAESTWSGFSAGVLSYLLTQYLWETTPTTRAFTVFSQIASRRELGVLACQHPAVDGEVARLQQGSPYFLHPIQASAQGVAGVMQEIKGNRGQVWLGGIPPAVLCGLQNGTVLASVEETDPQVPPLSLRSRNGLTAQVASVENEGSLPPAGTPLQECTRMLSQSLKLVVGLDDSLGRIEKVDITSALAGLNWTETANPRDRQVDCLLGRITPQVAETLQGWGASVPVSGDAYGLFWSGREMVIDSFGSSGEAAGSAVQRLSHRMQHLLAAKRLRTTLNSGCSGLDLTVTLCTDQDGIVTPVLRQQTSRVTPTDPLSFPAVGPAQFGSGQPLRLEVENGSDQDLSLIVLSFDGRGQLSLLSPTPNGGGSPLPLIVRAQGNLEVPSLDPTSNYRLFPEVFTCQPGGLLELLVIASTRSLQSTLDLISAISREIGVTQAPILLNRPLDLAGMALRDLTHDISDADLRQLQHQEVAILSMTYSVI